MAKITPSGGDFILGIGGTHLALAGSNDTDNNELRATYEGLTYTYGSSSWFLNQASLKKMYIQDPITKVEFSAYNYSANTKHEVAFDVTFADGFVYRLLMTGESDQYIMRRKPGYNYEWWRIINSQVLSS